MTRKLFAVASWVFVVAGVALAAFHFVAASETQDFLYLVATIQLGVALLASAVWLRPDPATWPFLLSVVVFSVLGQVFDGRYDGGTSGRIIPEACFFAVQLTFAIGLVVVVRKRIGTDSSAVIADGLVVGLGAWLVVWVLLLQPSLGTLDETTLVTATRGATLGLSTVVLFLLATLVFSGVAGNVSVSFISVAIGVSLAGDLMYAINNRGGSVIDPKFADAPYIAALFMASAGFLHPSVRQITSPIRRRVNTPVVSRLLLTTISLVAPILVLALTDSKDTTDRVVRTVSVVVLAVAVTSRVIQAVRANARAQGELMKTAHTDSLTGLPNRSLMLEHISVALRDASDRNHQPTVLFIDVDRFKTINDSLGHSAGDDVLSAVATRLTNAIPEHSIVGRISGDEFVVLDGRTASTTQAVLLAERVLDAFREPLSLRQGDMFVSASVGVATAPPGLGITADNLLRHADTAMYRAKDAGRNCIALFDESMLERVTQRLVVETALYRALERKELRLVHQPIVDTELGIVIGFEALMRWDRDDGNTVSPAEFIPIAEETGTIVPIGSWAILDALTQLRHWIDSGVCRPSTTMSVNVSPRQLHDPNFVAVVHEALTRSGVSPESLWLEMTESVMITEPEQALSALRKLVGLGVRVAIDDFGTGYSSLSLLQKFPIQRIKIDKAFVQSLADDKSVASLVKTIIAMSESLSLDVVAEGVEHARQLQILRSLNCSKAQGFLISHPVPVESIPSTVAALENLSSWNKFSS